MLVYLASPYSHKDLQVMTARYHAACAAAAKLMTKNTAIFAPIAHSHPISDYMDEEKRTDFDFWMAQDLPVLCHCDEVWVLKLEGWEKSRGVTREIQVATSVGIKVNYIDPADIGIYVETYMEAA